MKNDAKYIELGKIIKEYRKRAGLSQNQLGIKLGYKNGVYMSRWESGDKVPGARNLERLAVELNIPASILFPNAREAPGEYDNITLPTLINVIKRQLIEAEHRYVIIASKSKVVEVPIMPTDRIPVNFIVGAPNNGHIHIPKEALEPLEPEAYQDVFAIEATTDTGVPFGINQGAYVILLHNPPRIDGALYLITYQGVMCYRHIKWIGPGAVLVDHNGFQTEAKAKDIIISGRVLRYYQAPPPMKLI